MWTDKINKVWKYDCLEAMPELPDKSIDMILCDLPYGTTACKWDTIIPFEPLWKEYKRIIKDNGAIVLTASQPFTSALVMSNPDMFKYEWIWEKSKATGFLDCNKRPMKAHENILVFSNGQTTYNAQKEKGEPYYRGKIDYQPPHYGKQKPKIVESKDGSRFPRSVLYYKTAESEGKSQHPTQKPVALFEYLIKTYTSVGDTILDNCIGSGTTAVAAINTGRNFIGIEMDTGYCEVANKRIAEARQNIISKLPL